MKPAITLLMMMFACAVASGQDARSVSSGPTGAASDSTEAVAPRESPEIDHWLNLDLTLGRMFLGSRWTPYSKPTFLSFSCQRKLNGSWPWIDGAIVVAWEAEGRDAEGHPAGPGTSLVELLGGLGHWWYFNRLPVSVYAGSGLAYAWGNLTLPDLSQPPLPASEFVGHPVYPDMDESGNFWGGYLRSSFVVRPGEKWYLGVGAMGTLTTTRTLLGRNLSASSASIGIFGGVGD